jgi:hypothetical protein
MYDGAFRGMGMQTLVEEFGLGLTLSMLRVMSDSSVAKSFVATRAPETMGAFGSQDVVVARTCPEGLVGCWKGQWCLKFDGLADEVPQYREVGTFLFSTWDCAVGAGLQVRV